MIRANFRMNKGESGCSYLRVQYYGLKGGYFTNEMIRVQYAMFGFVQVEKESVLNSAYYNRESVRTVRSNIRRILNNPKAKVIFTSTGRS